MKDKNGFEIQVGDLLRHVGGGDVRADVFEPGGTVTDGPLWYEFQHGMRGAGACRTEEFWAIVSRADGSVPTKGANMGEVTRPVVDKWGRDVRVGDLYLSSYGLPGRTCRYLAENAYLCRQSWAQCEIIQRGLPTDPVPVSFEPERDAEGRPVLQEDRDAWTASGEMLNRLDAAAKTLASGGGKIAFAKVGSVAGIGDIDPTPQQRYAAFRATVERVVGEEAPRARVVTDWSGNEGQAWLRLGDESFEFRLELTGGPYDQDVRNLLVNFGNQLAARAMGRAK